MKKKRVVSFLLCFLIILNNPFMNIAKADAPDRKINDKELFYDKWKNGRGWTEIQDVNGNAVDPNGSAVEYNGLRIVTKDSSMGTVYCKTGDYLGITSWIQTKDYSKENRLKNGKVIIGNLIMVQGLVLLRKNYGKWYLI